MARAEVSLEGWFEREPTLELSRAFRPRGVVLSVGDGVSQVAGLPELGSEELVVFDSGAIGMAYDLLERHVGIVMLTGAERIRAGEGCHAAGMLPSITAGEELLGRLVDPLGTPLDGGARPVGAPRPALREAPPLTARGPVCKPLITGILAVDAAIPIGCGQRQLLVGDRNVGKTALALDIVYAQRATGVVCIYVVIGQPLSRVLAIRAALRDRSAIDHVVLVSAEAADPPGMQYLAPYAGMALSESFAEQGRDVLVVFDDLTKHADAYRELTLLLGRPPGREAYPGDIFYVHAELLERATAFAKHLGGGSISALPIVETTDGDISAYIPTNLISITDGQLYLDAGRFERDQRPAIDVGKSVSRIGGAAQSPLMRAVSRNLRIDLARFETVEALSRVGLSLDPKTQDALQRGRLLRELMRQPRFSPRSTAQQALSLIAAEHGLLDGTTPGSARQQLAAIDTQAAERAMAAFPRAGGDAAREAFVDTLRALLGAPRAPAS